MLANRAPLATFLIRFILLSAPLYALIYFKADFRWAQTAVAEQIAALGRLAGLQAVADGWLVRSNGVILEIIDACVAWKDMLAFIALVIAVPGKRGWDRLSGVCLGVLAIHVANITRLLTILLFAVRRPELVQLVHTLLWKVGMIAFILLLWISWLWNTPSVPGKAKPKKA